MPGRTYDLPTQTPAPQTRAAAPRLLAGRPTDVTRNRLRGSGFGSLVPREQITSFRPVEGSTVLETLRSVRDRDPDAAQAVNNLLLLMGQGYQVEARHAGRTTVHAAATKYLQAFDARIGEEYGGGMDAVIDVLNLTLITQGAEAVELELSPDLREIVDVHPVDPGRVTFKRDASGKLQRGIMVQRGTAGADGDGFLALSPRQFRYMPLHPDVDQPYGRSPLVAALTAIFFKIELLDDLRAVIHNLGYPRLDISVLEEVVLKNAPTKLKQAGRETELRDYVNGIVAEIQDAYNGLDPTDSFVHLDSVTVDYKGPSGGSFDVRGLIQVIDTQIIAGLKHLPVLLGRNEGATTTHATVQWRIFVLEVAALQRRTKRILEWIHTTALQVAGFQATAHVTFDTQPTSERLTDAQIEETEARTWETRVKHGWATNDEAAQAQLGHDAVGPANEGAESDT